ncbi:hypothetical protein BDZ97DRAFT_1915575 [Flammula alnicola]|nr:hypothetical protein BDZ97DRAFT_1915575 [Flammula alnicola]
MSVDTSRSQNPTSGSAIAADPTTQSTSPSRGDAPRAGEPDMPEQRHAGKVGYGPNYQSGPTLEDRVVGLKDEIKGKVTHNPDLVRLGHEKLTGEERRKKMIGADEPDPFASAKDDSSKSEKSHSHSEGSFKLPSASSSKSTEGTTGTSAKATTGGPGGTAANQGSGPGAKEQAATTTQQGAHDAPVERQ